MCLLYEPNVGERRKPKPSNLLLLATSAVANSSRCGPFDTPFPSGSHILPTIAQPHSSNPPHFPPFPLHTHSLTLQLIWPNLLIVSSLLSPSLTLVDRITRGSRRIVLRTSSWVFVDES